MGKRRIESLGAARATPAGRFGQRATKAQSRWLARAIPPGELLLGWLGVTAAVLPAAAPPIDGRTRWRFLLTDRRLALVAFGSRSRVAEVPLPRDAVHVSRRLGRAAMQLGEHRWTSQFDNDELFDEIAPLLPLAGDDRVREVARLSWRCKAGPDEHKGYVSSLLQQLSERAEDPLDELTWLCITGRIDPCDDEGPSHGEASPATDDLDRCLQKLVEGERTSGQLGRWADQWSIAKADKLIIVERLRAMSPERRAASLSLSLRRQVRHDHRGATLRPAQAASADASFAEHLQMAGQRREARRILEERLELLGEASVDELSVDAGPEGVLVGGELGRARREVLLLLASFDADDEPRRLARLRELARLEPVSPSRIEALRCGGDEDLARRAARVQELLGPGALLASAEDDGDRGLGPIDRAELEQRLPHPAARDAGVVVQIQQWLGRAQQPDYATIKSYSERATTDVHPTLLDALADASLALGVDGVEGFVSRGERRLGVRAYEASPPFLVVGGDHLDEGSDFSLDERELRFAVGAEVAHLRFGYTRLTSSELWDGLLYRGKQALDVAAMLAGPLGALGNLLRGAQRVSSVERVLRQVGVVSRKAAGVFGVAKEIQQVWGPGQGSEAGQPDELSGADPAQLLAACRAMQLGADRAGLLLAGDLGAALRAVFLSSRVYAAELRMAERHGLTKSLSRQDAEGALPQPELSLRLASLCAFYLSEDYAALRRAMTRDG